MLRKIRIILASAFFALITLLFLDFTGTIHRWFGWLAKIQFLPALLALNLLIVASLVIITLVFGRIYCSVVCPLGVMQDIIAWIPGRMKKKNKFRYSYSPAKNILRYSILALFILSIILGIGSFTALLAPYSSFGRIASNLLAPLWQTGNNILAYISERIDSYAFYSTDIWIKSVSTFLIAALSFAIIYYLSWKNGRTYCNTVCPVGSFLGLISRFSLFAPVIDTDKCRNCGLCGRHCKSACIDMRNHKIDYSRCVACMDCLDTCSEGAISYKFRYCNNPGNSHMTSMKENTSTDRSTDKGRRNFCTTAALITTTAALKAQEMKVDGGLAPIIRKAAPHRDTNLKPAGAISIKNFSEHCTGCQLCVSVCPNGVLRPSTSLMTLMQPEMSFERGWCRPECTKCSEVCPAGAIIKISREEKTSIQTGHAVISQDDCLVNKEGTSCGNCARHCPAGAISMVRKDPSDKNSLRIPVVNESRCIGCGACEYLCPSRPLSAIHIEGHQVHKHI